MKDWIIFLVATAVSLTLLPSGCSFVFQAQSRSVNTNPRVANGQLQARLVSTNDDYNIDSVHDNIRRNALFQALTVPLALPFISAANAAVMDPSANSKVFKEGKALTEEEAVARLREGRKSAQYLLDHYDEICNRGGDEVRRYAGTVGTSSGLFAIGKVMATLADRADDFVEYTELSNEVLKSLQQVDGSAYMAIFVSTSTSQTPPSKYFADAKVEVKRAIKALDDLAVLIDVEF